MKTITLSFLFIFTCCSLTFAERPPNSSLDQGGDNCSDVVDLGSAFGTWNGSTVGYANDYGPYDYGFNGEPDCWVGSYSSDNTGYAPDVAYKWTVPASGNYRFSLCGSDYNTSLWIFDYLCPTEPDSSNLICGNDDNPDACGLLSQKSALEVLPLLAGQELLVVVDGESFFGSGGEGDYTLTIEPGHNCDNPVYCGTPTESEPNSPCTNPDPTTLNCGDSLYGYICETTNPFDPENDYFRFVVPPRTTTTITLFDGLNCDQNPTQDVSFDYFSSDCVDLVGAVESSLDIDNYSETQSSTYYLRVFSNTDNSPYKITISCAEFPPCTDQDTVWTHTYGGGGNEYGLSAIQTTDCGFAFAGIINGSYGLVKTDANGDSLWSCTYGSSGYCAAMQQTSDGGYILAGYSQAYGAGNEDFWLVKTAANGDSLWSRTFGGSDIDRCNSVAQTFDGGYILGGFTQSFGTPDNNDFWMVKTNANGDSLWSRTFPGSSLDECTSIQQTADGGYALAGRKWSSIGGNTNFWFLKTDSTGDWLWNRTYGGTASESCHAMLQTSDGGYVMVGSTSSFGAGGYDFWMLKTDASGDSLWSRTFGGAGLDICYAVCESSIDNGFVLIGQTNSIGAGDDDVWAIKTDSLGNPAWSRTYGGLEQDRAAGVDEADDGSIIVGGFTLSSGNGGSDFYTIKTEPISFCVGEAPAAPQELIIIPDGSDLHLSWSPVVSFGEDCLIHATYYLVFHSGEPDGPFLYLGSTVEFFEPNFTHYNALQFSEKMFYNVVAVSNPLPALLSISPGTPKQKVLELLNNR